MPDYSSGGCDAPDPELYAAAKARQQAAKEAKAQEDEKRKATAAAAEVEREKLEAEGPSVKGNLTAAQQRVVELCKGDDSLKGKVLSFEAKKKTLLVRCGGMGMPQFMKVEKTIHKHAKAGGVEVSNVEVDID
eukprot:Hpha_TRINITY_DN15909_c1_g5::TRINITY_DN15909_c1_g5_i1::g.72657::m.72657